MGNTAEKFFYQRLFIKLRPRAELRGGALFQIPSRSVSRVLSCTVIYLALTLPSRSSDINETAKRATFQAVSQSCIGRGLHGFLRRRRNGELLPRLSTLTGLRLRFISVALSLKSPSQGFLLRPALRCSDFPHGRRRPRDRITDSGLYLTLFYAFCKAFYNKCEIR